MEKLSKYYLFIKPTNYMIALKLFVYDKNIWTHITVQIIRINTYLKI